MKKKKKNRSRGAYTTGVLFALAVLLLLGSMAGSSQAALTYYSENYSATLQMYDIGVTLMENERDVSWRNYAQRDDRWDEGGGALLSLMLYTGQNGEQESLQLGKDYKEALRVRNSGNIDEYVRVVIYRYWVDVEKKADGTLVPLEEREKRPDISPDFIELKPWKDLETSGSALSHNGWVMDTAASTDERMVLYYTGVLGKGQKTPTFVDFLAISKDVEGELWQIGADGKYTYESEQFVLEIEADAVQTHNAKDAIKSAWGVDVTVDANGTLSLGR